MNFIGLVAEKKYKIGFLNHPIHKSKNTFLTGFLPALQLIQDHLKKSWRRSKDFEVFSCFVWSPGARGFEEKRIIFTDFSRGYLGLFDPKTGSLQEWPSPGGPQSHP